MKIFKINIIFLFFITVFLFIPLVVSSEEKSWNFKNWEVEININPDSSFNVSEKQTFNFIGDFHYVTRYIAKKDFYKIADVKVYDQDGNLLTGDQIEITEDFSYVYIQVNFDKKDTSYTWIFDYTIYGGLGFYNDYDELYWNAVSSERAVDIEKVKVTVNLPTEQESDKIWAKIYSGVCGSNNETQEYQVLGNQQIVYQGNNILPYDCYTIVAVWPKGVVEEPGYLYATSVPEGSEVIIDNEKSGKQTPAYFLIGYEVEEGIHTIDFEKWGYIAEPENILLEEGSDKEFKSTLNELGWHRSLKKVLFSIILLYFLSPIVVIIYYVFRWFKYGRDPKGRGVIIARYEPPDKSKPAVMGTLFDEKADLKDISASIIDLAYRGYIQIIEEGKKSILSKNDYTFICQRDYKGDKELKEFEKLILDGIFGKSQKKIKLSDLSNKFYKQLPKIKKELYQEMMDREYFRKSPDSVRKKWRSVGIVLVFVGIIGIAVYGLGLPMLFIGILSIIFGIIMPQKTQKGVIAREWAKGFKDYLHTAERFRLQDMKPEIFERYLSYAMVFGVEKEWADRFVDIYKKQPEWYQTTAPIGVFNISNFTSSLSSSFNSSVSSTFTSTPGGSSGGGVSGFSGGGFSGGGGGGGASGAG